MPTKKTQVALSINDSYILKVYISFAFVDYEEQFQHKISNLCPLFSSSYLNWNTNVATEIHCDYHWSLVGLPIQHLQVKHEDCQSKIELKRTLRSPFLYLPSSFFVTATGKMLFGGKYKTVRSHHDAFIPFNLTSKKKRSGNPQCGSKNRVCWYKEMRHWWACNQKLPRRTLTMAASFSCLCELHGATGFEGGAQRGRSKAVQPDRPSSCLSAPDCTKDVKRRWPVESFSNCWPIFQLTKIRLMMVLFSQGSGQPWGRNCRCTNVVCTSCPLWLPPGAALWPSELTPQQLPSPASALCPQATSGAGPPPPQQALSSPVSCHLSHWLVTSSVTLSRVSTLS